MKKKTSKIKKKLGALGFKKLNIDASLGRPSASLAPLYMRHFRSDFNPLCFQSVPPTSFLASSFCRILFIYIFTTRNDDRAARLRITYTTTTCYYCLLRTKKRTCKVGKKRNLDQLVSCCRVYSKIQS